VVTAMPRLQAKLEPMISHRFGLDEVIEAIDAARSPASAKVMVNI